MSGLDRTKNADDGLKSFYVALGLAIIVSWPINFWKFTQCDFEAPYKCEIVHGAGVFPIAGVITAWMSPEVGLDDCRERRAL